MKKLEGIVKKSELVPEDSFVENGLNDTQLEKQSVDPEICASIMAWAGTLMLRSIIYFFTMEFVKSWWKKFKSIYVSKKEVKNESTQPIPSEAEKKED